jgi:hypothetical protein
VKGQSGGEGAVESVWELIDARAIGGDGSDGDLGEVELSMEEGEESGGDKGKKEERKEGTWWSQA